MKRAFPLPILIAAVLAAPVADAAAQQGKELVPVKLDLVVSRTLGSKQISSMPYTLWVTANADRQTQLRMGVELPIATTTLQRAKEGEDPRPVESYQYRHVGASIDTQVTTQADGRFLVLVNLSENGVNLDPDSKTAPSRPSFRNFTSVFRLLLKDGQKATYTSATDPVTGETLKVDVRLTVLK